MAYITPQRASRVPFIGDWLKRVVESISDAMRRRRVYEQTYQELSGLSKRELDDIGMSRADIPEVARKAASQA